MKTKAPIVLAALLAAGGLTHAQTVSAHSTTECEREAYDFCMETNWPQSWCVPVAEQKCAGHSHGGGVSPSGAGLIILDNPKMKLQRN